MESKLEDTKTLSDYAAMLRRRSMIIFFTFTSTLAVTAAVAIGLPSIYQSAATILIEQQEIPQDLVRSTITSYANQRIEVIRQRVITSANLLAIVNKFGLYKEERKEEPTEVILEKMREEILLETVSADVVDPRSGKATQATIAFKLSYQGKVPELVQSVANELASLYLNENLKSRRQLTAGTSTFLTDEVNRLKQEVETFEGNLAEFKERNAGQLPELTQLNLQLMEKVERELLEVDRQMQTQDQNKIFLSAQLSQLPPTIESATGVVERPRTVISRTGESQLMDPTDQLEALETEYVGLTSRYGDSHPDVVRVRKEINALRTSVGGGGASSFLSTELDLARQQLAVAERRYSNAHPDVRRLERKVASLTSQLRSQPPAPTRARGPGTTTVANPAYVDINAKLQSAQASLTTLAQKREELRAKLTEYEERLIRTPQVEREYNALKRGYENALTKFRELTAKQTEARLAETLESEQKGERFVLIEPPQLPEKPASPNRVAIALLGFFLSLAGGVGLAAVAETLDTSVRGARGITRLLGAPPLASIPYIETVVERRNRFFRRVLKFVIVLVAIAIAVWLYDTFVTPIDVVWFSFTRKLGL